MQSDERFVRASYVSGFRQCYFFRPEAKRAQRAQFEGTILVARPVSNLILACVFGAFSIALIAGIALVQVTRTVEIPGVLAPRDGILLLPSPGIGVIAEVRATQGSEVQQGDVLFSVSFDNSTPSDPEALDAARIELQSQLASMRSEREASLRLLSLRAKSLQLLILKKKAEIAGMRGRITLAHASLDLRSKAVQRYRALGNFFSEAAVEQQLQLELVEKDKAAEFENSLVVFESELLKLESDHDSLPQLEYQERARSERAIAQLSAQLSESEVRRAIIVRAPRAGRLSMFNVNIGQRTALGEILGSIETSEPGTSAELFATSKEVGFVKPGAHVDIRVDAFPAETYGKFSGTVQEIARSPALSLSDSMSPARGEPVYKISVRIEPKSFLLDGSPATLRSGMRLAGAVAIGRRRIWDWTVPSSMSN